MAHGDTFRFNDTLVDAVLQQNRELANEIERRLEQWLDSPNFPGEVTFDKNVSMESDLAVNGTVDFDGAIQGNAFAWKSYTPAWTATTTNPVINNGSLVGRYVELGDIVLVRARIQAGSTTTFGSGTYSLSLPVAPNTTVELSGTAYFRDNSTAGRYPLICQRGGTGSTTLFFQRTDNRATVTRTVPVTWAQSDTLDVHLFYGAA